ncbi:MAG: hypothetical protein ACK6DQ_20885, partial [Planctomycetota bacterium]
ALISEGRITVTALTTASDLSIASTADVFLGTINASGASVFISAGTNITDNDNNNSSLNILADRLQMRAGNLIGRSDTGQSNVNLNRQAITTQVSTLAAQAAAGIYIQERDGVTIDTVVNTVNRVNFNSSNLTNTRSLEDLTTTDNGPVLLQSLAGSIVVNGGATGGSGINANGTGNILLQTLNSGTIITNADIQSDTGNISLASRDSLTIDQRLKTSSNGTIYLVSQGDLAINALDTNNTNLGAVASGNLSIGHIQAGTANVSLQAGINVRDNPNLTSPLNVSASKLTIIAGGRVGEADPNASPNTNSMAIVTSVGSLAVRSATGAYIQEINGLTVESITNPLQQVLFRGNTRNQSQTLEDLTTTNNGPVKLQSLTGNIVINPGTVGSNGISAHGTGDVL